MNLQNYFQLEGLAYRLVPIHQTSQRGQLGSIDSDIMFDNMINKFRWGGVQDSSVYLDENNMRMLGNFRNNFGRLAETLINEGKKDSAKIVLDRCMEIMPHDRVPFDYFMLQIIENYYRLGYTEKARTYVIQLSDVTSEELKYFLESGRQYRNNLEYELQLRMHVMQEIVRMTETYDQKEISDKQLQIFQEFVNLYSLNN
jgi:tetratricopeptide (TPR) repeat protein